MDLRRVHRRRWEGAGRPDAAGSLRAAEHRAELSGKPEEAEPGRKATGSAFPAPLCRMSQSEPVAVRHVMGFTTRLSLGDRMPHEQYWARVRAGQDCPLRQGAWYRVVELTPVEAIVDVNHRLLHIPRAFVQVLPLRPPAWTVVPGPDVGGAAVPDSGRAAPASGNPAFPDPRRD